VASFVDADERVEVAPSYSHAEAPHGGSLSDSVTTVRPPHPSWALGQLGMLARFGHASRVWFSITTVIDGRTTYKGAGAVLTYQAILLH